MNQPITLRGSRAGTAKASFLAVLLSGGLVGSAVAPASSAPGTLRVQPGVDVLVNDPSTDPDDRTTQSETSLAVRGSTICAGFNDSGPHPGLSGFARSPDLGATWTDQGELQASVASQDGDPVLAVDRTSGRFYYAEIGNIGGRSVIGVARSNDDCRKFGLFVDASPVGSRLGGFQDKPWIAVDNTGGSNRGNVYVCWTRFGPNTTGEIRFSRSIDGGATYVNEQVLEPAGTGPFGCNVEVGPAGQVYVVWADRSLFGGADDIRFRSSIDAGQTFAPTVTVSTGNRHPGIDRMRDCRPRGGQQAVMRPTLNSDIRMLHQAWLAVDTTGGRFNGNLYVVWASDPVGATDNSDVLFSRSTDGGATWSAAVQVGAGGGETDQFEPNVAVGGRGTVSIAWYDRRNDPQNNFRIDVFKTFSRNGGASLDPIVRVTDVDFGVPPLNPNFDPAIITCYMGEYIAVEGDAQNFYYLWGDNRNMVTNDSFPDGRPDPDVWFEFEKAPRLTSIPLG
jgi:hypothetical protein